MLRGMTALFGPSRSEVREIAVAYLEELQRGAAGEFVPCDQIMRDFEGLRRRRGWPMLQSDVLMRELAALGCPSFQAVKVPWLGKPAPDGAQAEPPRAPADTVAVSKMLRRRREKSASTGSALAMRCLKDLQQRLAEGEIIPSQELLAGDWSVAKSTVSDWLREWEAAELIPRRQRERRCNVLRLPQPEVCAA